MVPDPGYLTGAQALLRRHNALLIADEVPPKPAGQGLCKTLSNLYCRGVPPRLWIRKVSVMQRSLVRHNGLQVASSIARTAVTHMCQP